MFGHGPAGSGQLYVLVDGSSAVKNPFGSVWAVSTSRSVKSYRPTGALPMPAISPKSVALGSIETLRLSLTRPQNVAGTGTSVKSSKFGAIDLASRTGTSFVSQSGLAWPSYGLPPASMKSWLVTCTVCRAPAHGGGG